MKEKLCIAIAWRLPRVLVYWCAVRLISYASMGKWASQGVSDLLVMEALVRWEEDVP